MIAEEALSQDKKLKLLDSLFASLCKEKHLKSPPTKFSSLSINAMITLQDKEKPNVFNDFAKCLGECRPNSTET